MAHQTITGLFGRVWYLTEEFVAWSSNTTEELSRLEQHNRKLLLRDVGDIIQDGRAYYVRYQEEVEKLPKTDLLNKQRLLVDLMLMNPMEANVGDVIYGPGFDAVFHPNKEATSWRFIPPLNVPSLNDVPSNIPGRIPKQIFERLSSGHWRRIS